MKQISWMVLGWLLLLASAQAASFDCAKVQSKVEHLICDNPEISKLDDILAASYKAALQDQTKADAIKQTQKQWMKERNGCADAGCVQGAYRKRIEQLHPVQNAPVQQAQAESKPALESSTDKTACLAPNIDWRNYEWTLIRGGGQLVCEEMLAYLKSRPQDIAPPTCPEERLPPNGNWARPEIRDVSEEERQAILRDIPERYRQKAKGPFSYEQQIKVSQHLRVIRGDITRDGIPESFLALGGYADLQKTCERSKRCGRPGEIVNHWIVLASDSYDLLPMNDEGTQVNWSHRSIYPNLLTSGELIYYKGLPYWMSVVSWDQYFQDHFSN